MTSETFRPPQFTGFGSSGNVQTSVWPLPVGTGFTLTLVLQSSAAVEALPSDCYLTNVLSDFGDTLSFATDPVFGLPDGYSSNSADAGILGNLYATPVPEPACGALAALGLLIVAGRASRRRFAVATAAAVLPLLAVPPTQKRSSGVPPGRNDFLYASVFETANPDCGTAHRSLPPAMTSGTP